MRKCWKKSPIKKRVQVYKKTTKGSKSKFFSQNSFMWSFILKSYLYVVISNGIDIAQTREVELNMD